MPAASSNSITGEVSLHGTTSPRRRMLWAGIAVVAIVALLVIVGLAALGRRSPPPQITGRLRKVGWVAGMPNVCTFRMDLTRRGGAPPRNFGVELLPVGITQPLPRHVANLEGSELDPKGGPLVVTVTFQQRPVSPVAFQVLLEEYTQTAGWKRQLLGKRDLVEESARVLINSPPITLPVPLSTGLRPNSQVGPQNQ